MEQPKKFPGKYAELIFIVSLLMSHLAALVGSVVTPVDLAFLRDSAMMAQPMGRVLALFMAAWGDPLAPFLASVLWSLTGLFLLYAGLRKLVSTFFASAAMMALLLAGYPGWTTLLPAAWQFWWLPGGAVVYVLGLFLTKRLTTWNEKLARLIKSRWWKAAWLTLVIFAFFIEAEDLRVGLRAPATGKFPYEKAGMPQGFSPELSDLRRLHHVLEYAHVTRYSNVQFNDLRHCLYGHGAPARYACRLGVYTGQSDFPPNDVEFTPNGWTLSLIPRELNDLQLITFRSTESLKPTLNRGGIRYAQLEAEVDGRTDNWFGARQHIWAQGARDVLLKGPVYRRAKDRTLWVEAECADPDGLTIDITFNGEKLKVNRNVYKAGDRMLVRGATKLLFDEGLSGLPLEIAVHAPRGLLDLDLLISPEDPDQLFKPKSELQKTGFVHPLM